MSDIRSFASEMFALKCLGLDYGHCLKTETQLMCEYSQICQIPEGIWVIDSKITSVEVKRIVGNSLPSEGGGRRRIVNRSHIIWPWSSTVRSAVLKGMTFLMEDCNVQVHFVVFIIPETLSMGVRNKMQRHIFKIISQMTPLFTRKMRVFVFPGPAHLFDRL